MLISESAKPEKVSEYSSSGMQGSPTPSASHPGMHASHAATTHTTAHDFTLLMGAVEQVACRPGVGDPASAPALIGQRASHQPACAVGSSANGVATEAS